METANRTKCKVCEKREWIESDNGSPSFATLEIPKYANLLQILDQNNQTEYLFHARYCPFCGKMLTTPFYWEDDDYITAQ